MDQEFPQYLIDTWKKKKLIVVFVILTSVVVISAIIGAIGPEELYTRKLDFGLSRSKNLHSYSQNVTIVSLTKNHQLLLVQSKFRNRQGYGLTVELPFETRVFGNNVEPWNETSEFEEIVSTVHQRVPKQNCTSHTIAYMPYLKYRNYRVESIHHFNELGYLFDHIYFDSKEERNTRRYYLPRIIPLLLISLLIIIIYFNLITNELNDPQIEEERDIAGFHKESATYKKRFLFFFTLELILMIFGNLEFFGNFLPKVRTSSYEFIMMFSVDTIIIIFYGFSFLPSDTENIFRNIKKRKKQKKKDQIISNVYNPDVSQNENLNSGSGIDGEIDINLHDHQNILESDYEEDQNQKSELQKNNDRDSSIINSQSEFSDQKSNSDKKQIITYQDSHLDGSQNENLINSGSENN
ncbi:transmembrane protein [Anaeramoeba flamelloides]|uniref:Transmembrane protein n=1 Tax=Anaeramoeba flamelloides TaxID=1746091 RepID=A0AAV7Z340_9EUKA|nr:transmembrane protein [Anaeramoeba flamelloides]